MGNQNPYIKEQTAQWWKEKNTKGKTTIYKKYISSKRSSNRTPTKDRGELRCSRRVCRSWSTSGTRRVDIVTNPIISHEWVKEPWSAYDKWNISWSLWHIYSITVNQVKAVTVTFSKWWLHLYRKEPLIAVASVLAASSNKEILIGATSSEISYHLRDIFPFCWNGATYKWKVYNEKI
jgi:hypothetical protein